MTAPELSHIVRAETIGVVPRVVAIEANEGERSALAARFVLTAIGALTATVTLVREGESVSAQGRIVAAVVQSCIATGDPVPARIDVPFALRFVAARDDAEEIELGEADLDTLPYDGDGIDLGEAVAQELALALDPFPRAPGADAALRAAGVLREEEAAAQRIADSPFAVLGKLGGG